MGRSRRLCPRGKRELRFEITDQARTIGEGLLKAIIRFHKEQDTAIAEKHLTVGIAGHVDHGKTTLVKCLTGVDTDRLRGEKRRGLSIESGITPLQPPPEQYSLWWTSLGIPTVERTLHDVPFDPQTSGGMLISVNEEKALDLVRALKSRGIGAAAVVGAVIALTKKRISLSNKRRALW